MLEDLLNNKYATPIKNSLDNKGASLNQNQFDALVSMAYNIGVGGGEFTSYAKLFIKSEDRYKTMLAVAQYIDKRR